MNADQAPVRIEWDSCRQSDWDRLTDQLAFCPFEQCWVYGAAYARRAANSVNRAVIYESDSPVALAQIFRRKVAGVVTLAQILRGPVFLDPDIAPARAGAIMRALKAACQGTSRQVLFWTPELRDVPESIAAMRICGMRRILTGYGSVQVDLTQDTETLRQTLHGKWRNGLVHAEKSDLRVESATGGFAIPWLLERYEALQRRRRFGGPDPVLLAHILTDVPARDILLLRAFARNEPVAATLFLRHGQGASYLVGWTGDSGRPLNAGALLLWQGMRALQDRGATTLDLGGIDTRKAPGIARFKLGIGGHPYRLAGTFA